jgi:uncharacterized membrane protein
MSVGRSGTAVHRLFELGLLAKLLDGALETVAALLLLLFKAPQINHWLQELTRHEIEQNRSRLWTALFFHAQHPLSPQTRLYAAAFLLGHGLIKIALVVALLRTQRWAYPVAMVVFSMFVVSQALRYSSTHSAWLLALTVLDVIVIGLTWLEFRRTRGTGAAPPAPAGRTDEAWRWPRARTGLR